TLSQEKLCRPIVACELGRLYNKDAVIEFLLDKSADKTPVEAASHIKSIKNVTELNLADNPAWSGDKESKKGDTYDDIQSARFICPVVGLEMNGRHRFCFLRNCGCVFSERALKEIKTEVCHKGKQEVCNHEGHRLCATRCVSENAVLRGTVGNPFPVLKAEGFFLSRSPGVAHRNPESDKTLWEVPQTAVSSHCSLLRFIFCGSS
uniref:Replication termination factor 2 n=1 Tax=Pavo cristatus TaxID=9049 RepID=A0A8C9FPF1_PAVCR